MSASLGLYLNDGFLAMADRDEIKIHQLERGDRLQLRVHAETLGKVR